jgi:hypothetical protein
MTPERTLTVNGKKVEEFYWAGKLIVYVDHHLVETDFDTTCQSLLLPGQKIVKNLMSKRPVILEEGTPLCCDPSSETYWSM